MKISVKIIKAKNKNEVFYYKNKLEKSKKKIYDIKEDYNNNYLYIIYDLNENIDDLINYNLVESQEGIIKDHCKPISKNELQKLFEKENSMCKIKIKKIINNKLENMIGSGFFLEINDKGIPFNKCLLTNNHIISQENLEKEKEIKIDYLNKEKKITLSKDRNFFTNKNLDYTCIEILEEDKITHFFKIDRYIIERGITIYKNEDIFILQFPEGNDLSFSYGKILSINKDNEIIHNCSTQEGSSGSPIITRNDEYSIIGLHVGSYPKGKKEVFFNLSTSIISIINDIKQNINFKRQQENMKRNKNIYIINMNPMMLDMNQMPPIDGGLEGIFMNPMGMNQMGMKGMNPMGMIGIDSMGMKGINPMGMMGIDSMGIPMVMNQMGMKGMNPMGMMEMNSMGMISNKPILDIDEDGWNLIFEKRGRKIIVVISPEKEFQEAITFYTKKSGDFDDKQKFILNGKSIYPFLKIGESGLSNNCLITVISMKNVIGAFCE